MALKFFFLHIIFTFFTCIFLFVVFSSGQIAYAQQDELNENSVCFAPDIVCFLLSTQSSEIADCKCKEAACNQEMLKNSEMYVSESECLRVINEAREKEQNETDNSSVSPNEPIGLNRRKLSTRRLQLRAEEKLLNATIKNILLHPEEYREGIKRITREILNGGGEYVRRYSAGLSKLVKYIMEEVNSNGGMNMDNAMRLLSIFGGI